MLIEQNMSDCEQGESVMILVRQIKMEEVADTVEGRLLTDPKGDWGGGVVSKWMVLSNMVGLNVGQSVENSPSPSNALSLISWNWSEKHEEGVHDSLPVSTSADETLCSFSSLSPSTPERMTDCPLTHNHSKLRPTREKNEAAVD
ncbi:hypothetical protein BLNAU_12008 [Blattamonas nauphoetae]|uniref:Uncharacterized protein n=1 Tax=Blattamonas nauphoetae TaxID=2049346 RepID=A0ABQ9XQD8_9EUKA|nr:hypothetical protein BLNAU_12008 [Blattamonas nauphoetae]